MRFTCIDANTHQSTAKSALESSAQAWVKLCLISVLMTNTACWRSVEQMGSKDYECTALSWIFTTTSIDLEGGRRGEYRVGEVAPKFGAT